MDHSIQAWGGSPDVDSPRARIIKSNWTERHNGLKVEAIAEMVNTRDDVVGKLSKIECPVLLIQGEKDLTWGSEESEIEIKELKKGELKVVQGEGHMLIFLKEVPEVNAWAQEFIKKLGY